MAAATLIFSEKRIDPNGAIVQIRIWALPDGRRVPGSSHGYKYSLYYGRAGQRILGYDNEAGKGDHVHRNDVQAPYCFVSIERLIDDFITEVEILNQVLHQRL
ncbi:toxin-antitoxin system TumE family protein [Methylobacterium sp. A54F]